MKKLRVITIGADSASHFLAVLSVETTKQKSVQYPHETGHRDLPAQRRNEISKKIRSFYLNQFQ